jgi:hypothetical protein
MTFIIDGTAGATFPNSTVQASAGVVLQVVNATYSTQTSNSTGTYVDTGLTGTITPKFSTSKILVEVHQNGVVKTTNDTAANIQLLRGASVLAYFSGYAGQNGGTTPNSVGSVSISYLDSPATTSATTYKTQISSVSSNASVSAQQTSSTSTITLWEIAG